MRPSATTSHVKTEHISANQIFNTLEEAEEAARKQNQAWGVDHLPYDPKASQAQYGNTYASAFPPSSSVYQQPAPTDPRPLAPEPHIPAASMPAEPLTGAAPVTVPVEEDLSG